MSASSSFIAKNRVGILGVSRLAQTIFLMACSADPWRTADGLRFGTSPVSRQTNEALRPSDGNPEVIGWSVGLVLTNALLVRRAGTGSCFSPRQRRPLPMAKSKRKRVPKTVLKLPDLEQSKSAVLNSLTSSSSKRSYDHAIREFIDWYCSEPRLAFNRTVVTRYRIALEQHPYAPSTINLRLAAIRRLAYEASDCGLLSPDLAAGIRRVKGVRRLGVRVGNWLTAEEGKKLLGAETACTLRSRRNRALLSLLIGCGLRRAEVTTLRLEDLQLREGHWVIADLRGKGGHIRTIPVPQWVKEGVDNWTVGAGITSGPLLRSINKAGRIWGHGFTPKVIWAIVKANAKSCGLPSVAPHDLRRTCARLCHQAGGELDQIQFLLGHVSIQTTERYLGCKQRFHDAVNDHIGLEPDAPS
jgi:integrase